MERRREEVLEMERLWKENWVLESWREGRMGDVGDCGDMVAKKLKGGEKRWMLETVRVYELKRWREERSCG